MLLLLRQFRPIIPEYSQILFIAYYSQNYSGIISAGMLVIMLVMMVMSSLGQHCTPGMITTGPVKPNADLPTQG